MSTKAANNRAAVGFTVPTAIYDKMRHTKATADILNGDIRLYVTRDTFKTSWETWYAAWNAFFDKTMDNKLSNVLSSDEIAAQAEAYRQDLARWQAGYAREVGPDGKPLPSNSPTIPIVPPTPLPNEKKDEGIPLWPFLVGVGVIGAGVAAYFALRKAHSMSREVNQKLLPLVLSAESPALAQAVSTLARDMPKQLPACGHDCGRDLSIRELPRAASKYYLSSL